MEKVDDKIILSGLVLLQILVCLPFIQSFPIALDEPFSIFQSQRDLIGLLTELGAGNNAPLHFVLLKYWTSFVGISPLGVRSLSLLISLITIYPLYKLGKSIMNKNFATLVVLFFVFSRMMHYQALEARMYGLFTMAFTFILWDLYQVIFEDKFNWWRLALFNTVLFYTHYIGALVIGFELVVLLMFVKKLNGQKIKYLVFSFLLTLVLTLPQIGLFIGRLGDFNANGTWVARPGFRDFFIVCLKFLNNPFTTWFLIGFTLLVTILTKSFSKFKKHLGIFLYLISFVAIPLLFFFSYSRVGTPIFLDRYLAFIIIPILLFFTYCLFIGLKGKKFQAISFLALIPFFFSVKFAPDTNREPQKVAAFVKKIHTENTAIAIFPSFYDLNFCYHYNQSWFNNPDKFYQELALNNISSIYNFGDIKLNESIDKIILIDAFGFFLYPNNTVLVDCMAWGKITNQGTYKWEVNIYQFEKSED